MLKNQIFATPGRVPTLSTITSLQALILIFWMGLLNSTTVNHCLLWVTCTWILLWFRNCCQNVAMVSLHPDYGWMAVRPS